MEVIANLGHPVSNKQVNIETLSKGYVLVTGTPNLTFNELNELIGVCHHQIEVNAKRKQ